MAGGSLGLEGLLAGYRPHDDLEGDHLRRLRGLMQLPGDPCDADRFDPGHVTASGYILSADRQSLLLIFHEQLGRWLQPGGHVEPEDADLISTARREVREETGLQELQSIPARSALFDIDVHPIPAKHPRPAHTHYDLRWLFRAGESELRPGSDVKIAHWVPLDQVLERNDDPSMRRALAKLAPIVTNP